MNTFKFIPFFVFIVLFSCKEEYRTYKLMTYNIRYDNPNDGENNWYKRKTFLCDQIAFNEPDVFGIQEGLQHQVDFIGSSFIGCDYVGVGRDDGKKKGEYCAIFYNVEKFKLIKDSTFWLSKTPNKISVGWDASMERICTYALLEDKSTKQRLWVFNAHFDHIGNTARIKSSELIVQKITELNDQHNPVILMGDLNLKPDSAPIQYLSKELNDSRTVTVSKPFGPVGTYNGFRFDQPVTDRIDYIFVEGNNLEVKKYAVLSDSKDSRYPSDHLPVLVEVIIKDD